MGGVARSPPGRLCACTDSRDAASRPASAMPRESTLGGRDETKVGESAALFKHAIPRIRMISRTRNVARFGKARRHRLFSPYRYAQLFLLLAGDRTDLAACIRVAR